MRYSSCMRTLIIYHTVLRNKHTSSNMQFKPSLYVGTEGYLVSCIYVRITYSTFQGTHASYVLIDRFFLFLRF